ncbi:MAG: DUF881 domain-containing protein [Firmicutes bacterium]|nr:DUF881 domain-containing protein [Bacillota bacterium]HOB34130.1 DUF881 domain-containing protein [Bacillota bacterium]
MRPGMKLLYGLMALALLLSVVLILNALGLIRFEAEEFQMAKNYALNLLEYNLELASEFKVPKTDLRVNLNYRRLKDQINNAGTPEELYHIILTEMKRFEQIIREQADINLANSLSQAILNDPRLGYLTESAEVTINFLADSTTIVGGEFLHQMTVDRILSYKVPSGLSLQTLTIVVDVSGNRPTTRIKEPLMAQDPLQHMQNQYMFLEQEFNNLRSLSGYGEMLGPGLIISLMDADGEIYDQNQIIHDVDVQQVVHYLYAGGARGISVGERRLTATSSIRCVGGPILINYQPVPVKPLVIKAVGDPEAMLEVVQPLLDSYVRERSLRVQVETVSELRLPGQPLR